MGKPGLVDADVQPIIDPTEFYAGCYAIASFNFYAWAHDEGGTGISAGLMNIQKVKDGEPFGAGNSKPEDDFAAIESDEKPTKATPGFLS